MKISSFITQRHINKTLMIMFTSSEATCWWGKFTNLLDCFSLVLKHDWWHLRHLYVNLSIFNDYFRVRKNLLVYVMACTILLHDYSCCCCGLVCRIIRWKIWTLRSTSLQIILTFLACWSPKVCWRCWVSLWAALLMLLFVVVWQQSCQLVISKWRRVKNLDNAFYVFYIFDTKHQKRWSRIFWTLKIHIKRTIGVYWRIRSDPRTRSVIELVWSWSKQTGPVQSQKKNRNEQWQDVTWTYSIYHTATYCNLNNAVSNSNSYFLVWLFGF